jgi:hypothetical protein
MFLSLSQQSSCAGSRPRPLTASRAERLPARPATIDAWGADHGSLRRVSKLVLPQ